MHIDPPAPPCNIQGEQALLGALFLQNDLLYSLPPALVATSFFEPLHQRIFAAIRDTIDRGGRADPVVLRAKFDADPALVDIGGGGYLTKLAAHAVLPGTAVNLAESLCDLATRRRIISACHKTIAQAHSLGDDSTAGDIAAELAGQLDTDAAEAGRYRIRTEREVTEELYERMKSRKFTPRFPTGFSKLDLAMDGGLFAGKLYGIVGRKKHGKAQPLTARVLTLDGWKRMRDIRVGDRLASPDGQESVVQGVYPQGEKEIYRVRFADGRETHCCKEHLWTVEGYRGKGREVVDTASLRAKAGLSLPTYIPWYQGRHGGGELPVPPYLLGALLGDGGLSQSRVMFTTADEEMIRYLEAKIPNGMEMRKVAKYDYCIKVAPKLGSLKASKPNPLKDRLAALGLMGKKTHAKFIPAMYLAASPEDRWELLRGLADTDGHVARGGCVSIATSSAQLARDIRHLVRSLGGLAKIKRKVTPCRPSFNVKIRHPFPSECFRLTRKKDKAIGVRKHQCRLTVKSVEYAYTAPAQCIGVSHPDGLYVTDEFIVTHNTMLASSISTNLQKAGTRHIFLALEMGSTEIHQRALAGEIDCFESAFRTGFGETDGFLSKLADYARSAKNYRLYLDAPGLTFADLRHLLPAMIRRYKLTGFVLDCWQLVGGKGKGLSTAEHLDAVAQWLAECCKRYGVWGLVTAQENQDENTRGGEGIRLAVDQLYRIGKSDVGSSYIWLDMMETRYTGWQGVGQEGHPALQLSEKFTHFEQMT